MEIFVLLEDPTILREDWSIAVALPGGMYAALDGRALMVVQWFVDTWDTSMAAQLVSVGRVAMKYLRCE